jgi:hypothetical protein
MTYDASATWSGFNYQGKIALFHTLRVINQELNLDSNIDFTDYSLLLEYHEDFEICKNNRPLSFHQVKAYKEKNFSSYKNAVLEIALELKNYSDINGYLHTWNEVRLPKGKKNLKEAIKEEIDSILEDYDVSTDKSNSIIGKALDQDNRISKKSKILKNAFKKIKDIKEVDIYKTLQAICKNDTGTIGRIEFYKYPDDNHFCYLDHVERLIKDELLKYYEKQNIPSTEQQINQAYHYFLGKIDQHIIDRHQNLNQGRPIELSFEEILIISKTDFEDISDDYLKFNFKSEFVKQFDSFCSEPELCTDESHSLCGDGGTCHLKEIVNILYIMPAEKLWEYYKIIVPHKNLCAEKNIINAIHVDLDSVLFVLFYIFYELDSDRKYHQKKNNRICYRRISDMGNTYLPTAISTDSTNSKATLAKHILDNQLMLESLYEIQTIIAGRGAKKIDCLRDAVNKHRYVGDLEKYCADFSDNRRDKINEIFQNIRLIPIEQAKDEINAD